MLVKKMLAAFKSNSKVLKMINPDPSSTNIITRRTFLKTFIGAAAGFHFFGLFSLKNDTELVRHQPALVIADEVQSPQPQPIINKPFINAFNHIETPTYDRSGQAVHPSVIDFKTEYGIETWGEFRYWMVFTPYPNFNSAFENPSLLVSKDGLTWIDPPNIKNPLALKPLGSLNGNYNSDPELVYDPDQNTLILYWREYSGNVFEKIWVKKISSDYKQSDKILCFEKAWDYKKTGLVLSPTVWRKSANEWYMWTTDGNLTMHLYASTDGITWSSGQPCSVPWDTWNGGYIPWHIAAKPNPIKQTIDFLVAGWPKQGTIKDCQLLYATAPMSQPKEITMPLLGSLLVAGASDQWDNGYIYRSSFVLEPGDAPKFRIWYSACSKEKAWHIGYTEGTLDNITSNTQQT
ncbi:hypothetical protein [Desulfosporosinus sp. Sb-LF]|uniref:hypothetical protein n=1 Tax=Desulfosporosinus sp. Sb-LF TaxID=2560027 RepID=UPI00107F2D43|nr:hypothetical protein [Desulfosporosinus sp. Sb-LF]TGE33706.1 hypothetical protein E4K68_06110 [Desulfosporosinus sp. Sb-LF]